MTDPSRGYEQYAEEFMRRRTSNIGPDVVKEWAAHLKPNAQVLELGCGHGVVSQVLIDAGLKLYAIDASPTLLAAFHQRFPQAETECAAAEESTFFNRIFDAIVAWGLIFLLEEDAQKTILRKAAHALRPGGRLLFTAPSQICEWIDVMTRQPSRSLGAAAYERLLRDAGLEVTPGGTDSGENYYYCAQKPANF